MRIQDTLLGAVFLGLVAGKRMRLGQVIRCRWCGAHTSYAVTTLPIVHTEHCTRGESNG